MALLDPLHYSIITGTVVAPRHDDSEATTLERLVDSMLDKQYGAYSLEYCTFIAVPCSLPERMIKSIQEQGIAVPAYGFMLFTFFLSNDTMHNLA